MKINQKKLILNDLLNGKRISPLDALKKYGCLRLGARIYDLKNEGYDIKAQMVGKNGKRYAEYWMEVDKCKN